MARWTGRLINLGRELQRRSAKIENGIRKVSWHAKLLLVSIVSCSLAILGLYFTDHTHKEIQKKERSRQQQERLEEAARAWAIQRTLLELNDPKLSEPTGRKNQDLRILRSRFESRAREALNLRDTPPSDVSSNVFLYAVDDGTRLRSALLSLLSRGSLALLVISILLALAVMVFPIFKNLMEVAQKRLEQGSEIPGEKPPGAGLSPIPTPILIGRPEAFPSPSASIPPAGGPPHSLLQSLMPTVVAAGALIAIGAIFINVAGRDVSVTPEISSVPRVGLDINDFAVAVQPGRVDIPAAQIVPADSPDIKASIPPVEFHFPMARIEQQALTALTQELTEYRETMQRLAVQNQELATLQETVSQQKVKIAQLQGDKNSLQAQLELRPTREQLNQVMATIEKQNQLDIVTGERLSSLVTVGTDQQYGDRLAARQYARELYAQNKNFFNKLFRPDFIQENCRAYAGVKKEFPMIPEIPGCTNP